MKDIQIADSSDDTQLFEERPKRSMTVRLLDESIGTGTMEVTEDCFTVEGTYQWPRQAAEVRFSFVLKILGHNKCQFQVDWPGLLPEKISEDEASFMKLLVLARARYVIAATDGVVGGVNFVGPADQPQISTGMQVNAGTSDGKAAAHLTFVVD